MASINEELVHDPILGSLYHLLNHLAAGEADRETVSSVIEVQINIWKVRHWSKRWQVIMTLGSQARAQVAELLIPVLATVRQDKVFIEHLEQVLGARFIDERLVVAPEVHESHDTVPSFFRKSTVSVPPVTDFDVTRCVK